MNYSGGKVRKSEETKEEVTDESKNAFKIRE